MAGAFQRNMNITFLIGNGFDIGMGLKSRFRDFFPIYVRRSENKPKEIRMLSERIGTDFETWSDFEAQMGDYTAEFNGESKRLYIKQIRDFEMEFMKYLRREEGLSFDITQLPKMKKTVKRGLRNFCSLDYLREESSTVISNFINTCHDRCEGIKYNFIVFNYTNVLERCLLMLIGGVVKLHFDPEYWLLFADKVGKIYHIHGSIDDRPIMGVNDASQIVNAELAEDEIFTRYIVKPKLNSLHGTGHDADGARLISNSQIICIYGMSLGATDRCWWERILQWLNGEEERQLAIFDHDKNYIRSSQFDWIDKEDAIMEKLARYVPDVEMDIEKLRPRIHIAVNKDIFQLPSKKAEDSKVPAPV